MSKILLVEDDNNLREIYEARLQAEGYVIASAKDGEEALVVAKSEKPDLIISDVMMPKISGFEMLDILRNTPELRDTKVIMLTALGQAEDQSRASHLGADRYLVKSQVTLEDIVKVAHELLEDTPQEQAAPEPVQASPAPSPALETPLQPAPPAEPMQQQPIAPAPEPVQASPAPSPALETPLQPAPPAEPMQQQPIAPAPLDTTHEHSTVNLVNAAMPSAEPDSNLTAELPTENTQTQNPASDEILIDASGQLSSNDLAGVTQVDHQPLQPIAQPTPPAPAQSGSTISAPAMATTQASNDQTLNQAFDDLMSETNQPPLQQTPAQNTANDTAPSVDNESAALPSNAVNGRKIIQPLDQQPQKSLDELLAMEGASEQAVQPPGREPITINQNKPFDPTDPNNIAL